MSFLIYVLQGSIFEYKKSYTSEKTIYYVFTTLYAVLFGVRFFMNFTYLLSKEYLTKKKDSGLNIYLYICVYYLVNK